MIVGMVISFSGCAKPDKELADAQAALQEAREAGAQEFAPEEYQAAEDLIARAKELMAQGKHKKARDLLVEARYKAIEAKGKAWIGKRESEMTPTEQLARERKLEMLKGKGFEGIESLKDIFFDFDRYAIRADARPVLAEDASAIKAYSGGGVIVIEGYCDIRGTAEYNLALGQRRAASTKDYLVGLGVDPAKVEAVSKGETEKFAPGTSDWAYQENRRAHFTSTEK